MMKTGPISAEDAAAIAAAEPSARSKALDHLMETNASGIHPLDLRVIVLPDAIEEKTAGGIILPEQHKEREKYAQIRGTLVAVGVNAWEEAASRSTRFTKPRPGDRVVISKYGGITIEGRDGREYRLLNDEDILGMEV